MSKDYVIFLGNGGGRYITSKQIFGTGGIYINMNSTSLFLDPGPGALVKAREVGLDLGSLDAILCSHSHLDHYSDLEAILEASYLDSRSNNRYLIASKSVSGKAEGWEKIVRDYFLRYVKEVIVSEPSKHAYVKDVKIEFSPTKHHDPYGVGFSFSTNNKKLCYISDSKYIEELKRYHKNCDVLIAHLVVRSDKDCGKDCIHATIDDIITMGNELKPRNFVVRHFGYDIIKEGVEKIIEIKKNIKKEIKEDINLIIPHDEFVLFF